jgi:hypothetical protein
LSRTTLIITINTCDKEFFLQEPVSAKSTIMKRQNGLTKLTRFRAYLISLIIVFQQVVCPAQPLNKNSKNASPLASWSKEKDIVFKAFPKEYSKEVKKIIDSMAIWTARSLDKLSGFSALGSTIQWHAIYLPKPESPPYIPAYRMEATIPAGTGNGLLTIAANDLSTLGQPFLLNGHSRYLIGSLEQRDSGIYSTGWERASEDSSGKTNTVKAWLISFTDSLPYVVVNRREYFEEAIKELDASKDSIKRAIRLEMRGKDAQQEEAFRKSELQAIANSFRGNDRLQRERDFLLTYKPDSVFQNDTLNARAAVIIEKTKLLKDLLESLKTLNKPAFVSAPAVAFEGLEDGMPGARLLTRLRPGYFRKNAPPERPQFLVLTWQYDSDNVDAAHLGETIGKELDLIALRKMLQIIK